VKNPGIFVTILVLALQPLRTYADSGEVSKEGSLRVVTSGFEGVLEDREYMIEDINSMLEIYPKIAQGIEGLAAAKKADGMEERFELRGISINDLDSEQLGELWQDLFQMSQNAHIEMIQDINRQQRTVREVQNIQRSLAASRAASHPAPARPPQRPPSIPAQAVNPGRK
jgi:hypothetical protein